MLILPLATTGAFPLKAQDIAEMVKEKPVKFSGSLSAQAVAYTTSRERAARDPFVWTLSGSPTLSVYGFQIPFSFTFSQRQRDFTQPFNQFGMSPYYKWIKLYLGYRNVTYSRYTLAGHQFLGGGLEATPGNFRFGFVYGRFLKAVEDDSMQVDYVIPAFKRTGYSVKLGYGTQSNYVDLILFHAKDDTSSIGRPDLEKGVLPAENLVAGIKTFQRLFKRLTLDLDFGYSVYTRNLYATEIDLPSVPLGPAVTALTTVNNSTWAGWAGNASLSYTLKYMGIRLMYRRIEPEYQSMGAYFFTNDLEQITVNPSLYLFKRKLNLTGSIGYQRNNLADDKVENTFRRVNSLMVNLNPGQNLGINASWMNYRIEQRRNPVIIRDFVDSLQMKQVSNNLSLNGNYAFGPSGLRHRITAGAGYQAFDDRNPNTDILNSSRSLSPFLNYNLDIKAALLSVYARMNYNTYSTTGMSQDRLGFTLGGTKRLADEKLNLTVSGTHYTNRIEHESDGATMMLRARVNYRIAKKHNFNLSLNYTDRNFRQDGKNNFNELLVRFGYSMRI